MSRRAPALYVTIHRRFAFSLVSTPLRLLALKGGRRADNVVIRLSFVRPARVGDIVVTDKLNRLIAHDASIVCDWRARAFFLSSSEICYRSLKIKLIYNAPHRAPPPTAKWTNVTNEGEDGSENYLKLYQRPRDSVNKVETCRADPRGFAALPVWIPPRDPRARCT